MLTDLFKALSDENRLRILNLLFCKEMCVCELEGILSMTQSNVSRHLIKLKNADIVVSKKSSQWAYYEMSSEFIGANCLLIEDLKLKFGANKQMLADIQKLTTLQSQQALCGEVSRVRTI